MWYIAIVIFFYFLFCYNLWQTKSYFMFEFIFIFLLLFTAEKSWMNEKDCAGCSVHVCIYMYFIKKKINSTYSLICMISPHFRVVNGIFLCTGSDNFSALLSNSFDFFKNNLLSINFGDLNVEWWWVLKWVARDSISMFNSENFYVIINGSLCLLRRSIGEKVSCVNLLMYCIISHSTNASIFICDVSIGIFSDIWWKKKDRISI